MKEIWELREHSAWRGAMLACALNAIASPIELFVGRKEGVPASPILLSAAVGILLFVRLLVLGPKSSLRDSTLAFLANMVAVAVFLWIANTAYARAVGPRFHYESTKLATLGTAFLAPSIWSGILTIAALAGAALVHVHTLPADLRANLYAEPFALAVYGGFGIALLTFCHKRRCFEWAMVRAQVEAAAMERLARTAMAIGDLANTPLQTIDLAVELLKRDVGDRARHYRRIDRALLRLRDLNAILARHEARLHPPRAFAGFDARDVLDPDGGSEAETRRRAFAPWRRRRR
jgi:type III secretory pathway component EscS